VDIQDERRALAGSKIGWAQKPAVDLKAVVAGDAELFGLGEIQLVKEGVVEGS